VNDWEFCDVTVDLTIQFNAPETPATIRCILASSAEAVSADVQEDSGTGRLQIADFAFNMEHRETYPVLRCSFEPDRVFFTLPYNHGTFTPPD
jgi:hypothetical protein